MGLFLHRDAGASRAGELRPLPHVYRPPETPPLSGEGACEVCGREHEDIVHALHRGPVPADPPAEFRWSDN
jgi:hypothetical protein